MRPIVEDGAAVGTDTRTAAIAAARRCFGRFGVDKTTMEDIAKEAGMARSRLYKSITTRQQVIEGAILERLKEIANEIKPLLAHSPSLADALMTGSLATTAATRGDPELTHLVETANTIRLHTVLTGRDPLAHEAFLSLWQEVFERGRARGELRDDVTDGDLIEWLSGVQMMLSLREDLEPARERRLLAKFLLPAFLTSSHRPAPDEDDSLNP
ncbi:MAG TPA: TetR/AcrR family transcriptional regulator [Pseudonocardia sp.]|nr:TetR/AcrR family transcriptional regulator [Pseudonocardia sp.]